MRRRALLVALRLALIAFACLASGVARAQTPQDQQSGSSIPSGASGAVLVPSQGTPSPPKDVVLVPPVVQTDPGAVYPERAITEGVSAPVTVVVIVEVDREGHVKSTKIEAPQGHGFDESALEAARGLIFKPGTRDGVPIAARIKHAYVFNPPSARLVGRVLATEGGPIGGATVSVRAGEGPETTATTSPDGRWTIDGVPGGTYHVKVTALGFRSHESDETVRFGEEASTVDRLSPIVVVDAGAEIEAEDVYVHGQAPPRDVTVRTLTQEELSRIPGTNGDALRAILSMPGVANTLTGLLVVRGSAPQDTQTFVDGTAIPLIYHFGGLSSVVPTEMLDKIDFYPGNFSTRYGRGFGGVIDVGLTEPKADKIHALAQVDFIDGRLMVQGPIADGWTFAVAGRRSWLDLWLKPVLQDTGAGVTAAPVYYDYQAMISKKWDKGRQSFRAAFFGSDDRLSILVNDVNSSDPALAGGISSRQGFWRGQLLYKNKLSDATELRANVAVGQDYEAISLANINVNITQWPISSRIELAQKIAREAIMDVGIDVLYEPYAVFAQLPPPSPPGQPPGGPFLSAPAVSTNVTGSISLPGFYDELELTPWKGSRIVPGIRLDYADNTRKWDLAPRLLVRQDLTTGFPRTTLKGAAGIYYEPPQSEQSNPIFGQVGLVSERATEYDVGIEQEFTKFVDLSIDGWYRYEDNLIVNGSLNSGTGNALGLETLLRWRPDGRFFGWLAYTLSRSVLQNGPGEPQYLSPYDQTHILTVIGSYRLGKGWQVGARFRFVSGFPYTPNTYGFYDENNATYLPQSAYPINGQRLPPFQELDIRVDKSWVFSKWQLSAYLDIWNVYNAGNPEGTGYNYNYTLTSYVNGIPFLPSFGLRAEF
ncbi:MAG: TonB family protein [Polyangiaceae bacterium]